MSPAPHFINRGPWRLFTNLGIIDDNEIFVDSPFSIFFPNTKSPLSVFFISNSPTSIFKLLANPKAALVGDPFKKAEFALGPFLTIILSSA